MGPGAMATQYIKMPADEHISSYYIDTEIQHNDCLEELNIDFLFFRDWATEDEEEDESSGITVEDILPRSSM